MEFRPDSMTILKEPSAAASKVEGIPIYLNIYDVSQEERVQTLNAVLAHRSSPLKLGGVFHAGLDVGGLEWSFSCCGAPGVTGVACDVPRCHPQHHFRQTVKLGTTQLSHGDIAGIVANLFEEYMGIEYDLLRRNCCSFAEDFSQRLGTGPIPAWVHRLAKLGACLDDVIRDAHRASRAATWGLRRAKEKCIRPSRIARERCGRVGNSFKRCTASHSSPPSTNRIPLHPSCIV